VTGVRRVLFRSQKIDDQLDPQKTAEK